MKYDYYLGALLQESGLWRFGFAAGCEARPSRAGGSPLFLLGCALDFSLLQAGNWAQPRMSFRGTARQAAPPIRRQSRFGTGAKSFQATSGIRLTLLAIGNT
jgi:hypothetical protein